MARIWRLTISLHESGLGQEDYCIEAFEKIRMGWDNRVLHFGIPKFPEQKDLDWVNEVMALEVQNLMIKTVGIAKPLDF